MDGIMFGYTTWTQFSYEVNEVVDGQEVADERRSDSGYGAQHSPRRRGFWETKAKQRHGMFDPPTLPVPCLAIGQRRFRMDLKKFRQAHPPDVEEDEVAPSAPPLDDLNVFTGYENTTFDAINVPPPEIQEQGAADSTRSSLRSENFRRSEIPQLHEVTEEVAKAALLSHVKKKCCYGAAAAKHMNIAKILQTSAFHYELQTFTEKRETSWAFTPYGGGSIDSNEFGQPPLPWEITSEPEMLFHNEVKVMEVPHTATVKHCHRCHGAGSLLCHQCHGKGWTPCLTCHGDGWRTDSHGRRDLCFYCHSSTHGHGKQDCLKCNARGCVACPTCDGYGQIRCFIRLTITWNTATAEHIVERCSLPQDLVKQVSGQVAFEEEGPRILPIMDFPDATINMASVQLTKEHTSAFNDQRIVAQRHQIRIVPISQVSYEWKSYSGTFVMIGFENRVYCPDYPQTCCWGCNIL